MARSLQSFGALRRTGAKWRRKTHFVKFFVTGTTHRFTHFPADDFREILTKNVNRCRRENCLNRISKFSPKGSFSPKSLIMSADISVGGHILPGFFCLSVCLSFSSTPNLWCCWTELNQIGHMLGSNCDLKTHVQNLRYPLAYKSGAQKPPFWADFAFNGKFNGLYLRNEIWYRQSVKCVDNYKGSPTLSQNVTNFGPQAA